MNLVNKIRVLTWSLLSLSAATIAAEQEGQLVSVETAKTEMINPSLWLPGNVVSQTNAPISAEQTGQLLWIEDVGTQVAKDQVIARIDNRRLKLQLARQQAQLRQQEADVTYLQNQQQRMSVLAKKNSGSLSELERTIKDLTIAENEVVALQLLIEQTQLDLEKTEIKAPFTGSISERFAHVGELIVVGRPLVQLVDTYNLDIKVAAPIAIAPYLSVDTDVMVKWQDKLVELPIRTWSKSGDQSSRTFDVHLAATGIDLLAGAAVTVSLPKQVAEQATLVPRDALVLRENETFVLTIDEQQQAKKVNVLLGQGTGRWIAVSGAIYAGDDVIVRGGERLQQGQKVRFDNDYIASNKSLTTP